MSDTCQGSPWQKLLGRLGEPPGRRDESRFMQQDPRHLETGRTWRLTGKGSPVRETAWLGGQVLSGVRGGRF